MAAAARHPKQKKHKERQHSVRLSTAASSPSSPLFPSRALGKLKKATTTAQPFPNESRQRQNLSGSISSPAANAQAATGPVVAAGRGQGEGKKASDILKEYMQKQFFSKFRPQRAQRLRLRGSGVQQRQQQQLAIPTRKSVAADGAENVCKEMRKKKRVRSQEKTTASCDSRTLRKVCCEALTELGI